MEKTQLRLTRLSALWQSRAPNRLFLYFAILLVVASLVWQFRRTLTGDEPQYLMYAQSLLQDGDFDLTNNYADQTYRTFYPEKELGESVAKQSTDGHKYPAHSVGLSVLVAPGLALLGRVGAVFEITLVALGVVWLLRQFFFHVFKREPDLWLYLLCLCVPFVAYSSTIFTEMVAALLIYWVVWHLIIQKHRSMVHLLLVGLAIGLLYVVHYKYAVLIAVLLGLAIWQVVRRLLSPKDFFLMLMPAGLVFLAQSVAFQAMYGSWLPHKGIYPIEPMELTNILAGIPGLFLTQGTGLFWYAPIFVLFPAGLYILYQKERRLTLAFLGLLAVVLIFNGLNAPLIGYAPAGRMVLVLLPIIILATRAVRRFVPKLFSVLLAWSLVNTLAMLAVPQLVYSTGESNRLYWAYSQIIQVDVSQAFPKLIGFIENGTAWLPWTSQSIILTILWLGVWFGLSYYLVRRVRTTAS